MDFVDERPGWQRGGSVPFFLPRRSVSLSALLDELFGLFPMPSADTADQSVYSRKYVFQKYLALYVSIVLPKKHHYCTILLSVSQLQLRFAAGAFRCLHTSRPAFSFPVKLPAAKKRPTLCLIRPKNQRRAGRPARAKRRRSPDMVELSRPEINVVAIPAWVGSLCTSIIWKYDTKTKTTACFRIEKVNRLDGLVRTLALYGVLERNAIDSSK